MWNKAVIAAQVKDEKGNYIITLEFSNNTNSEKIKREYKVANKEVLRQCAVSQIADLNLQENLKSDIQVGEALELTINTPDRVLFIGKVNKLLEIKQLIDLQIIPGDAKEYTELLEDLKNSYDKSYYNL